MAERGPKDDGSRERQTLIPTFDPEDLAKAIEQESTRITAAPPFDVSAYARIVEQGVPFAREAAPSVPAEAEPETMSAPTAPAPRAVMRPGVDEDDAPDPEALGREMYASYLASDFPEALVLAGRVLDAKPDHALARLVIDRCRERIEGAGALSPSSVLRLRPAELERQAAQLDVTSSFVLGHVDGTTDAGTIAALTGLPPPEALDRLHALLDLGVVELVCA